MGAKLSCVAGPLLVMMALVEFRSAHVVGRIPNSSAYAEIVVCICAIVEAASLWRVRSTCLMYFGTAIVLSIPTMATVAKASGRVNPLALILLFIMAMQGASCSVADLFAFCMRPF